MRAIVFSVLLLAGMEAQAPPRSDRPPSAREEGQSSSKDTQVDIAAPGDDAKKHPESEDLTSEMKPWNPHKAIKNLEVGDYYFKQKNYRAAISRYREALEWKPRDATATFRLAQALDKNGDRSEAAESYQAYLKILPSGIYAADCRKALDRLKTSAAR